MCRVAQHGYLKDDDRGTLRAKCSQDDNMKKSTETAMSELTKSEKQDIINFLDLPKREFIRLNKQYIDEERNGKLYKVKTPGKCPLAIWVAHHDVKCHRQMVPNTASCPLCGSPMCPDCMNHVVDQLSRVTGYLAPVSGWNEAKKQELKERQKYTLPGRTA